MAGRVGTQEPQVATEGGSSLTAWSQKQRVALLHPKSRPDHPGGSCNFGEVAPVGN